MLKLSAVTLAYGPVMAVQEATLHVGQGEIVTLIGPNGAGKTTILRAVSGLIAPTSGSISFEGRDLDRLSPDKVVRLGLAHCPEGRQVLARQSVLDNLELGAYIRSDRAGVHQDLDMVFGLFPRLHERSGQLAGTLSGG
ncbi:MAG: ABC transporter ATP-binding protein, partial [Desulfovibrio sp.]|nr:ABC transporter ATP-binding protein [Desulfovibrio sp.]